MSAIDGPLQGRTAASALALAAAYDLKGTPATQAIERAAGLPKTGPGARRPLRAGSRSPAAWRSRR